MRRAALCLAFFLIGLAGAGERPRFHHRSKLTYSRLECLRKIAAIACQQRDNAFTDDERRIWRLCAEASKEIADILILEDLKEED